MRQTQRLLNDNVSETELKFWAAVVVALTAAVTSLVVSIISHLSTRSNARAIEALRDQYAESKAERDAKRDYQYEARKRLYQECGPILFQLSELSETALHRIVGLARSAKQGHLEPGEGSFLRDEYYRLSTLYRLLAPSAALKVLQKKLTLVDLSLDAALRRQYELIRQAFFAFGDEFPFAGFAPSLEYDPLDTKADHRAKAKPAVYWRQGLPLGIMERSIEALVVSEGSQVRVMTYAEFEAEYEKPKSRVRETFDDIGFLVEDFHPRTRPVLWRILVAQALLYRALTHPQNLNGPTWGMAELTGNGVEMPSFDWLKEGEIPPPGQRIEDPVAIAKKYFQERLTLRLERISGTTLA